MPEGSRQGYDMAKLGMSFPVESIVRFSVTVADDRLDCLVTVLHLIDFRSVHSLVHGSSNVFNQFPLT